MIEIFYNIIQEFINIKRGKKLFFYYILNKKDFKKNFL